MLHKCLWTVHCSECRYCCIELKTCLFCATEWSGADWCIVSMLCCTHTHIYTHAHTHIHTRTHIHTHKRAVHCMLVVLHTHAQTHRSQLSQVRLAALVLIEWKYSVLAERTGATTEFKSTLCSFDIIYHFITSIFAISWKQQLYIPLIPHVFFTLHQMLMWVFQLRVRQLRQEYFLKSQKLTANTHVITFFVHLHFRHVTRASSIRVFIWFPSNHVPRLQSTVEPLITDTDGEFKFCPL